MRSAASHLMALPVYKQAATIRPVTYTGIKNKNMNVGDKTYSDIMCNIGVIYGVVVVKPGVKDTVTSL